MVIKSKKRRRRHKGPEILRARREAEAALPQVFDEAVASEVAAATELPQFFAGEEAAAAPVPEPRPLFLPPPEEGLLAQIARQYTEPEAPPAPTLSPEAEALAGELQALGLTLGDRLLVQSSGWGAEEVPVLLEALREAVGAEGTIVVPTPTLSPEHSLEQPPVFDAIETPCEDLLGEGLRRLPEAKRSLHPTHSVAAWGPEAALYTDGHATTATPCGIGTPYHRMAEADGRLLLLGAALDDAVLFHCAEEFASCPYHLREGVTMATIVSQTGRTRMVPVRLVDTRTARHYGVLLPLLRTHGAVKEGTVGGRPALLIETGQALAVAMACLQTDPWYFTYEG